MTIKGKDLIKQIKDKEYSEDLIKELEKYEIKKPKSVWELENGDVYHYLVFEDGEWQCIVGKWWEVMDKKPRELGLVRLTKERAELHARVLTTELAIKKWKRENDNVELDLDDYKQQKYNLMYDVENEEMQTDYWNKFKFANTIYFSSELKAQQCINDIGEERIIEWLKWEDNDQ